MSYNKHVRRRQLLAAATSWMALATLPALALDPPALPAAIAASGAPANPATLFDTPVLADPPAPAPPAPSQNVTINLINRLVQRGVLTKDDAAELIRQAEQDAQAARAQAAAQPPDPPASDDAVRVTYVPEVVKAQMRDQIKQEVMDQARKENWANPRTLPDWVPHFRFTTDVRVRYEGDFYPAGNDNTGAFPNFNSINTGAPFDISGNQFSPQYNVDQNRNRYRIRARFGAEVDLDDGFTLGFRLGTGENDSPVTESQSLGAANNGQGGNFSKYSIWLDRAFIKYELGGKPDRDLTVSVGRFDNPFFSTSLIWANDLGFDGIALQGKYQVLPGVTPFLTIGAFPVFNTDFNFATNQPAKFKSEDKYLYAGQLGAEWKITKDLTAKVAGAYYYFQNIEGKLSSPFTPLTSSDQGNTDDSRPAFAQNGNTYMALRDIIPSALNNYGTIDQFQYFGLATPFHELAVTGRLDYSHFEPVQISLIGEYVQNLAFNRDAIGGIAVNNRGPNQPSGAVGSFAGGNTAWIVGLKVGSAALEKRWDWSLSVDYRYLESDSVVDGFNDQDFGTPLSGTNLKGYTVGGMLALSSRVSLGLRWMSANAIAGPTYKNDMIQFDLNAKF
jgi:hypothetical protein